MAGNNVSTRSETGRYVQIYDWPNEIADLANHVANGGNIKDWSEQPNRPQFKAVYNVLHANPQLMALYDEAKHAKAEGQDREIDRLKEALWKEAIDPRNARVLLDAIRLQRSHLAPGKYHDKHMSQTVTHTVDASLRDRIGRAGDRAVDITPANEDRSAHSNTNLPIREITVAQ